MAIPQFSPPNAPFTGSDGRLTFAANVFLRDMWLRSGGNNGVSNDELVAMIEARQAGVQFLDEGVNVGALGGITSLDVVGSGATLTAIGNAATLTIPGGGAGGGSIDDILMIGALL